ncbi:hypothetical protein PIB30_019962 [Stylosanthes scabra]|uniref:Uncharacterized protein n=1 Tax=Stylosanthes scabra TaxID=79078 RepID=A0ABU6X5T5_9FABA|nr:hypothetical protein [Stylosanthes scabra]
MISDILLEGNGGYRPDTQFDVSQVHLDLNESVSGPSHVFMALGGTPPSAVHVPGGSWEVPFMEPARLPTPQASPADSSAELHVVKVAAPEAIYGEMTITLKDVAYQLGLRNDDPISGCLSNWELHHECRSILDMCQEAFVHTPGLDVRQGWAVNIAWFRTIVCQNLGKNLTVEHIERYTQGYIMQLIGGLLFHDQSDIRVGLRRVPSLLDLERCG